MHLTHTACGSKTHFVDKRQKFRIPWAACKLHFFELACPSRSFLSIKIGLKAPHSIQLATKITGVVEERNYDLF